MKTPADIQLMAHELAIRWSDDSETYLPFALLRSASPSAETRGERDILGTQHGGHAPRAFPGVVIRSWETVGNYALRFDFSDGHRTGIYSYDYLQELDRKQGNP